MKEVSDMVTILSIRGLHLASLSGGGCGRGGVGVGGVGWGWEGGGFHAVRVVWLAVFLVVFVEIAFFSFVLNCFLITHTHTHTHTLYIYKRGKYIYIYIYFPLFSGRSLVFEFLSLHSPIWNSFELGPRSMCSYQFCQLD